jgi:hypothetical protein
VSASWLRTAARSAAHNPSASSLSIPSVARNTHDDYIGASVLIAAIGPQNVLAGFDFPHPEGLADPRSFFEDLSDWTPEVVGRIMSDNTRELLNL